MLLILVLPFVLSHWSLDFFAVIQVISFLEVGFIFKRTSFMVCTLFFTPIDEA